MATTSKRSLQGTPGSRTPAKLGKIPTHPERAAQVPTEHESMPPPARMGQQWTLTELSKRKVD